MGYHGSAGAVALQAGSYQGRCHAQPDMDHPRGRRKADNHTNKKSARYEINRTGRYIPHICHRLPIATPCYILLWNFLALAFALMSSRGVVEMV